MTTIRERVVDWLLRDEKTRLQASVESLIEAAQYGPFRKSPEMLVAELREYGSSWVTDLIGLQGYRILGGLPYGSNLETLRTYSLETSRYLWISNPLYQWAVNVWANYGVGDGVTIVCKDPEANEYWQECFKAERNTNFFSNDKTAENSETLSIEGNLFILQFISTLDGKSTFSLVMDTDEIKEIITDPNDRSAKLYYRREYSTDTVSTTTVYYADWSAFYSDKLKNYTLPTGAVSSATETENRTIALMHHIAFNRKDRKSPWGWPLGSIAGPYLDSHKEFVENRLTVSRNKASYVRERTVKGGSRAVASVRSALASRLSATSSGIDTNPPPVAGSEDIHNQAIETKDLAMSTGAGDAKTDWEMFSHQALIGIGLFNTTAGMDTSRWATALQMDKTLAMQWTRYQTFWAAQFQAYVTMALKAGEKWGRQSFETYDAQISIDTLSLVDFPGIVTSLSSLIGTGITPMVANGTMPIPAAKQLLRDLWKVALQALGISNVSTITSDESFEITPSEVKREYQAAMVEFADVARRVRVLINEGFDPDQPRDDKGRFGSGGGSGGGEGGSGGDKGDSGMPTGKKANTKQAVEIIQMQSMGAPQKHIEQYLKDNGIDYIEVYHATNSGNAENVQANGIKLSTQNDRPDASYFFLDKEDAKRNANNLGHHKEYSIVIARIPRDSAAKIRDDGLYNGTFSTSYSAARLLDPIPKEWVTGVEKVK